MSEVLFWGLWLVGCPVCFAVVIGETKGLKGWERCLKVLRVLPQVYAVWVFVWLVAVGLGAVIVMAVNGTWRLEP